MCVGSSRLKVGIEIEIEVVIKSKSGFHGVWVEEAAFGLGVGGRVSGFCGDGVERGWGGLGLDLL